MFSLFAVDWTFKTNIQAQANMQMAPRMTANPVVNLLAPSVALAAATVAQETSYPPQVAIPFGTITVALGAQILTAADALYEPEQHLLPAVEQSEFDAQIVQSSAAVAVAIKAVKAKNFICYCLVNNSINYKIKI